MQWKRQPLEMNDIVKLVGIVLVCALFFVGSAGAKSTPITGPVVITDPGQYHLAIDITDSTEPIGILVKTSNVIIDGKGKTIDGIDAPDSYGIRVYNAAMTLVNVVIKNVKVNDWNVGISFNDVKNSIIDKATVTSSVYDGVRLYNSHRNTVQNSVSKDNGGTGVLIYGQSSGNVIQGVTAQNSGVDGIRIYQANNNIVQKSKSIDNTRYGIYLEDGSNFNSLIQNAATGNDQGISLYRSNNNAITSNTIRDGNYGIYLNNNCLNNEIAKNTIQNTTYAGLRLNADADRNMVTGNKLDNNLQYGIWLNEADRNVMYDNLVRNNQVAGILTRNSKENIIINNYFYNTNNLDIPANTSMANVWNLPRYEQKSITGGKYSGGNSWGQPDGQGFSQVTPDANKDGICDSPYPLATNNIDTLPLKWKNVR